jgi:hypothetical protein
VRSSAMTSEIRCFQLGGPACGRPSRCAVADRSARTSGLSFITWADVMSRRPLCCAAVEILGGAVQQIAVVPEHAERRVAVIAQRAAVPASGMIMVPAQVLGCATDLAALAQLRLPPWPARPGTVAGDFRLSADPCSCFQLHAYGRSALHACRGRGSRVNLCQQVAPDQAGKIPSGLLAPAHPAVAVDAKAASPNGQQAEIRLTLGLGGFRVRHETYSISTGYSK